MKMFAGLLMLLTVLTPAFGYRYLVVFPMPSRSHNILGKGIVRALTDAGHQVTHITGVPDKDPHKLVEQIDVSHTFNIMKGAPNMLEQSAQPISFNEVKGFAHNITEMVLTDEKIQKLLMEESYDAVISEWFFSDIFVGFAAVFRCPWIHVAPAGQMPSLEYLTDEVQSPAVSPTIMTGYTVPMTFQQRLVNTFIVYYSMFQTIWYDHPREAAAYRAHFSAAAHARGFSLPPYEEVVHKMAALFINSHPALGQRLRLPGNAVQIAGYHIDSNVKPLPEDLQQLLDKSTSGAVYFSMGSNLKSADLPEQTRTKLLALFAKIKITVLWKFETKMEDTPPNVHISSWMPQQSILAHKNVKVFITHGGLLSVTEAVHFGKPLIAVPIFGDQFVNAKRSEKQGFAIDVDYRDQHFVDRLEAALVKVLGDQSYQDKAQELSKFLHDRPLPPAKMVSYWAEHVVRTNGAEHLRSPALEVPAYQRMLLDVAAFVAAVLAALALAVRFAIKKAIGLCKGGEQKKKKRN